MNLNENKTKQGNNTKPWKQQHQLKKFLLLIITYNRGNKPSLKPCMVWTGSILGLPWYIHLYFAMQCFIEEGTLFQDIFFELILVFIEHHLKFGCCEPLLLLGRCFRLFLLLRCCRRFVQHRLDGHSAKRVQEECEIGTSKMVCVK